MHHIFVNENTVDLLGKTIKLSKDDEAFKHLVKSLRINVKEKVLCSLVPFKSSFDYICEVANVDSENVTLTILEETVARELPVKINLYQGISKSDKLEFIIEKACELGVNKIIPLASEYCIAKIDEKKSNKKLERFNKIAKSAAEQSKRHIIPEVSEPIDFEDLVNSLHVNDLSFNLLFYENASKIAETKNVIQSIKKKVNENNDITINVIIGPEGGFSKKEIEKAEQKGFNILSLGERILRTETAAVTALSIIMYELQ